MEVTLNRTKHSFTMEERTVSKLRIVKNLIVLSFSFMLISSSIDGLQIFQSTLNRTEGLGVASIAVQFAFGVISALFLIKYSILKFGTKNVLATSLLFHIPSIAANFYPCWATMIPCHAILGLAAVLSWGANSAYLNGISSLYTNAQQQDKRSINYKNCVTNTSGKEKKQNIILNSLSQFHENAGINNVMSDQIKINYQSSGNVNNDTHNLKNVDSSFKRSKSSSAQVNKDIESTTARFFGFHSMLYQSGHIWINMISYLVLETGVQDTSFQRGASCLCGSNFCNVESECFESNLKEPGKELKYILLSIFLSLNTLAAILVGFLLDPLERKESTVSYNLDYFLATFRQMKDVKQILLVPLSMYMGMLTSYFYADFSKAYIGCAWGIYHVGYVAICYGITCSIMSTICGWLVKHLGRTAIFLAAAAVNAVMIITMLFWQPDASQPIMFFVISGMWGFVIGSYWAQLKGFHGILFKSNEEAAFSCFELCFSIGACMTCAYSNHLCIAVKLYILIFVSTIGIIGYLIVTRISNAENKK